MKTSELLVELGTEEIPASMLPPAANHFAAALAESLKAQRLPSGERTVWFTPRRIIVGIQDVPEKQEDLTETLTGPPKSVAFDSSGNPTKAAHAFAQKNRIKLSQIKIVQTPKGEYLSAVRKVRGEATKRVLQRLLPETIGKIPYPKTMYWSADKFRFARPLRWIVALYGGRVIPFRIGGVASSKYTSGHRLLGKSRLAVSSLSMLQEVLRANGVVVDPAERLKIIEEGLAQEAERAGGKVVQDPELTRMVVNLNEYPSVIRGSFDPEFLKLPQEILITVMREHQKYFSLVDDRGELLSHFLAVINLDADRNGVIRQGHERVLRARLADATFFWETDRKKKLLERRESLRQVLFQEKLGSYYDKTERVRRLLPEIASMMGRPELAADLLTAGQIYKCDLVTEMVKEFTDLQGVVGGLYAKVEGYPESVWRAIYEHYQPKSTSSPSPATPTGALLALADRLDTICGCFSVGLVPTGSKDPLAVRRQGNGMLKIVLDHRSQVSLKRLIELSLKTFSAESKETAGELLNFFEGRLRFLLEETGYSYDCINAGLAVGFDDPLDTMERIRALEQHRNADDLIAVASSFKRIKNILAQAGTSDGEVDPALMSDAAERTLWEDYLKIRPEVQEAAREHNYERALRAMASMRPSVDRFFDEVLVMCEDESQKRNRLSLLDRLAQLFLSVADISEIVKEKQ